MSNGDGISSTKRDSRTFGGFEKPVDGTYLMELKGVEFRDNRSENAEENSGEPYGEGKCLVFLKSIVKEAEVHSECVGLNHSEMYYVDVQHEHMVQKLLNVLVDLGVMPSGENFPLNVFNDKAIREKIEKKSPGATFGATLITKKDKKEGIDRQSFEEIMTTKAYKARASEGANDSGAFTPEKEKSQLASDW